MNIILFCATDRGLKFLLKVQELLPEANLIVISFVETPWEPKYLNNIKSATKAFNGRFEGQDAAYGIIQTNDNGFVFTGYSEGNMLLIKTNPWGFL